MCPIFNVPVPDDDHMRAIKWENQGCRSKPWGSRAPTLMIPGRPFYTCGLGSFVFCCLPPYVGLVVTAPAVLYADLDGDDSGDIVLSPSLSPYCYDLLHYCDAICEELMSRGGGG